MRGAPLSGGPESGPPRPRVEPSGDAPNEQPAPGRVVVVDEAAWAGEAARRIAEAIRRAGEERAGKARKLSLALSGGSTPGPAYTELAARVDVPWDDVEVFLADERAVPPGHPESNATLVRRALLDPLGDRAPRAHFPEGLHAATGATRSGRRESTRGAQEAAARAYDRLLPDPLDVLVLGLGEDGHTASLFPGRLAVRGGSTAPGASGSAPEASGSAPDGSNVRVLVERGAPKPPPVRLTVAPSVIERAREVLVLARGSAKADAARDALRGDWNPERAPAQLARRGTWVLDAAAAAKLPMETREA